MLSAVLLWPVSLFLKVSKIASSYSSAKDALRAQPGEDSVATKQRKDAELHAAWDTLHQYWQFVQDNPYDFNGWTYLLSHVETMVSIQLFSNLLNKMVDGLYVQTYCLF